MLARLSFLPLFLFCLANSSSSSSSESSDSSDNSDSGDRPDKPNILFLLVDDLGWNDIGFNGASDAHTPFIDELAQQESLILTNSYAQHYCTQSRAALLTGRYPLRMGLQHQVILPTMPYGMVTSIKYPRGDSETDLPVRTLPDMLRDHGYQTHLVGKWHLGFAEPNFMPNGRGFDSYYGFLTGKGDHFEHSNTFATFFGYDLRNNSEPTFAIGNYSSYLYGNFTQDLLKRIARSEDSKPFFIEHSFQIVHDPNETPINFREIYNDIPESRADRIAMSTAVDSTIEQLVTTLKTEGLWDNTLVILQSDNGGPVTSVASNFPLRGGKFSLYEGGVKTVTFVTGGALKKKRKGKTMKKLMHIVDWMPTLLDFAGIADDEHEYLSTLDGVSQLRTIQNNAAAVRNEIIHNINPIGCNSESNLCGSIRKGKWKLSVGFEVISPLSILAGWTGLGHVAPEDTNPTVECNSVQPEFSFNPSLPPFNGRPMLFNIKRDPCEHQDVSEEYPKVVDKLMKRLSKWNATMMPPLQLTFDHDFQGSNPANLDGFWGPWREDGLAEQELMM